jgi:hypothetical protein
MISSQAEVIIEVSNMVSNPPIASRVLALVILGAGISAAAAAGQISAGVQGNWGSDTNVGLGARGIVGLGGIVKGFETFGSFDYFFPSDDSGADITYWEVNANLVYRVNTGSSSMTPYAGAGLNIAYTKASTEVLGADVSGDETSAGLNLLGGIVFELGGVKPFLEGRFELGGGEQFVATVGLRL